MFQLWRNVHLAAGVAFFFVALLFAVSSVVIIYRPWFPSGAERSSTTSQLQPGVEARAVALELMRGHGMKGELRNVRTTDTETRFIVWRPGTHVDVTYFPATGVAQLETRRFNFYETLIQLHVNHGFWHDFLPANLWALLSFGVSVGLLLLGVSGIYLWFKHPQERQVGTVLLAIGFSIPLVALAITRIQGS
ncbi:MAG: hypothetical protein KIT83_02870 [Bryobacterales bacterium]|nr:hypothetical protein [Bryobacterales bacterium]